MSLYTIATTAQSVIIEDCFELGLNESTLENNTFFVYPNPVSDNLHISFTNNVNSKQQIAIYNAIGQLFRKEELSQSQQINISDLPSGLYFVILPRYGNQIQKFVKQ